MGCDHKLPRVPAYSRVREPWGKSDCPYINCFSLSSAPANAHVCPAVASDLNSLFIDSKFLYAINLLTFEPPYEAVRSKMLMKTCTDTIPFVRRLKLATIMVISFFILIFICIEATAHPHSEKGGQGAALWGTQSR